MLPSVGVTGSEQPWPNPPREQAHSTVKMGLQMVELWIEWLSKLVFISGNTQECSGVRLAWPATTEPPQSDGEGGDSPLAASSVRGGRSGL